VNYGLFATHPKSDWNNQGYDFYEKFSAGFDPLSYFPRKRESKVEPTEK
jgi:hypothetical protein